MKILIIEDEKGLLESIFNYLESQGYLCEKAENYFDAEDKLLAFKYDVIIIDIGLPDGNGLNLLEVIKKENLDSGILIISAKNSLDDKLKGLDLGADDYITKPFHLAELSSRINALLRRTKLQGNNKIVFNEIVINTDAAEVTIDGNFLNLTKKEYDLLVFFIINKNRVISKSSIAEHLWGDHIEFADNFDFIYTHIKNLRKKIIDAGGNDYLETVYRFGYKFTNK
jgi:DNA-binding response OmpR family regulator